MAPESVKGRSLGEVVQANRVPLALIGIGVAWLAASNTGLADRVANDERVQAARRRIGEIAGDIGLAGASTAEDRSGRMGPILGPDGQPLPRTADADRTNGWVHQTAAAARGAINSVRDAGNAVLDRASKYTDYAGDAGDLAKRAGGQVVETLRRDPWLIGVVGFVAGALFGAVLPPASVEREFIGEARDELWNKATELGHEAAERVRELASKQ
jgi:hypothetical protein